MSRSYTPPGERIPRSVAWRIGSLPGSQPDNSPNASLIDASGRVVKDQTGILKNSPTLSSPPRPIAAPRSPRHVPLEPFDPRPADAEAHDVAPTPAAPSPPTGRLVP